MSYIFLKRVSILAVFLCSINFATYCADDKTMYDSVVHHPAGQKEFTHFYKTHRTSSNYPVEIQTRERALMITSRQAQMLPIYTIKGIFYGLFRLEKGTNWINGLPCGAYLINNHKV